MRKRFYVEPEIDVKVYHFGDIVTGPSSDTGLDIENSPDAGGGNDGDFDGTGDLWGDIY